MAKKIGEVMQGENEGQRKGRKKEEHVQNRSRDGLCDNGRGMRRKIY